MRRRLFVLSMAGLLTVGTLLQGLMGQVSRAEVTPNPATGNAVTVQPSPEANTVTVQPLPEIGAATLLSVKKAASLKKVTITWSAVGNAQGYYVMRKLSGGVYENIATVTGLSYEDLSVEAGKKYVYQVVAFQRQTDGTVHTGTCTNEKTIALVPGKVKGLKVKRGRGRSFTITWKKTSGATGYQVYTKVFVKGYKLKYNKVKTTKKRKYKRVRLVRKMKYGFKVRAYKKVNGKKIYGPFSTVTKRY